MSGLRVLLHHAARNLSHGGLPLVFALLMTALGVLGLGAFITVAFNVDRVLAHVSESANVVAFLNVESAANADAIAAKMRSLEGVEKVTLVSPSAADLRVHRALEHDPTLLEQARGVSVGWVVELTPDYGAGANGDTVTALAKSVTGVDDVMHPGGEIERVESFLFLVRAAGGFLAGLIALIVVLVIHNVVKLTLYARREEIGIMKLVGATDVFVRTPFLIVGWVEGLLGALMGIAALYILHATFARLIGEALKSVFGNFRIDALPWEWSLAMVLCCAFLGVMGALISVRRFLQV